MDYDWSNIMGLFFAWTMLGLILWITWVDDCCVLGDEDGVKSAKEQMKSRFDCDEIGELTEYVGCKIQKLQIMFNLLNLFCCRVMKMNSISRRIGQHSRLQVLIKCAAGTDLSDEELTKYQQGV
jgi:hypothetical protein